MLFTMPNKRTAECIVLHEDVKFKLHEIRYDKCTVIDAYVYRSEITLFFITVYYNTHTINSMSVRQSV